MRRDVDGAVDRHFLWDGDNLLAELDAAGTGKLAEYSYWGMDRLHATILGTTPYYGHQDVRGNTLALTADSVPHRRYWYDAWGTLTSGGETPPFNGADRARWKGALSMGPELDLYYMRNRWYEPRTGRFLSEDPIGLAGGTNLYAFANDDPVNGSDPTGLCALYLITFIDLNGNNRADEGEVLAWECFFGGIDETEGGSGGDSGQQGRTECQRLADVAGQTAASSTSVDAFAVRLGVAVAGVDGTGASLGTGGQNLLNPTGSLPGGFRPELGGNATGQARHFAATVVSVARYGNTLAWLGWYRNEHFGTPGAAGDDWNLSRAAFSLMRDLRPGNRGRMPLDPALTLSGGGVRQWILSNVCVQ